MADDSSIIYEEKTTDNSFPSGKFFSFVKQNKILYLFAKFLLSIKKNGILTTIKKVVKYTHKQVQSFKKLSLAEINSLSYKSEYQNNIDFSSYESEVKAIAFYLPQFHAIPENDKWWGKDFTEWTNTRKAEPRFNGHYQPREPHDDFGYYNLTDVETIKKQALLAKQHGIYGFCFYFYWFSGKRLLEKPLDLFLEHPEIDINFCLCWANENWTRRWDGQDNEILIKQDYTDDDTFKFIKDIQKYINDKRYIKIDGVPVLLVYNPGHIPNVRDVFIKWRKYADDIKIGEIKIFVCKSFCKNFRALDIEDIIDGIVEFPPNTDSIPSIKTKNIPLDGRDANIYDYKELFLKIKNELKDTNKNTSESNNIQIYRTCMLGWDNAARKKNGWRTFAGFSLDIFYEWASLLVSETLKNKNNFFFINAWNEWAEGTYLEPDKKYGYANINTLSKALFSLPFDNQLKVLNIQNEICTVTTPKIAIHIHVFYTDIIGEIINHLSCITFDFDCFITTDDKKKSNIIEKEFNENKIKNMSKLIISVFKNRGRDVAPFIMQFKTYYKNYDYICHLHTKKTGTSEYGDGWRKYLFRHLLGSSENINSIIGLFEADKSLGIVFPETYPVLNRQAEWGGNKEGCYKVLKRLGLSINLPDNIVFPVGNMFWARINAISSLFQAGFTFDDFPVEKGQINLTLSHQIERLWVYLSKANGYSYLKTFNNCMQIVKPKNKKRITFYVHYDDKNVISNQDMKMIKHFAEFSNEYVFITNSKLSYEEKAKIEPYVSQIIERENEGYDFGAWRDAFIQYGFKNLKEFDQLILLNNSVFGPVFDMDRIFFKMENDSVDFWGITLFPELSDGSYLHKKNILEHIQSYFQVFEKQVFNSKEFEIFWLGIKDTSTLIEVIAKYESEFTSLLSKAGFTYSVFIPETRYLSKYLQDFSIPYSTPYSLIILGSPFIKKKSEIYMSLEEKQKLNHILLQLS